MERLIDWIYILYFGSHIPLALFIDSQALFPRWMYPTQLRDILDWYTNTYGDVMMKYHPAWFKSFIVSEMFLQFPFFFVALYAYWKGVSKCQWIRIPMIIYASHVVTSLLCIFSHIFFHEFSSKSRGPRDMKSRVQLGLFYLPYFIVPLMLLIDAIFHPSYVTSTARRNKTTKSN